MELKIDTDCCDEVGPRRPSQLLPEQFHNILTGSLICKIYGHKNIKSISG